MRLTKILVFVAFLCLSAAAFADAISFTDLGGTVTGPATTPTMFSVSSTINGYTNATTGKTTSGPNLGTVVFTATGAGAPVVSTSGTLKNGAGTIMTSSLYTYTGGTYTASGNGAGHPPVPSGTIFMGTFNTPTPTESTTLLETVTAKYKHGSIISSSTSDVFNGFLTNSQNGTLITVQTKLSSGTLSGTNTGQFSPTPEPGTLALFGTGLLGIGMIAKRRSSNNRSTTGTA